jgi:uncharacterized protein YgiM (DUF1202 family)
VAGQGFYLRGFRLDSRLGLVHPLGPPYYYVNVNGLALRSGPGTSYRILTTLNLNQRVKVLGSGPGGWLQVRNTRTNIIGWSYGRYLESLPVRYPRSTPRQRGSSRKGAPKSREAPKSTPNSM